MKTLKIVLGIAVAALVYSVAHQAFTTKTFSTQDDAQYVNGNQGNPPIMRET